MFEYGQCVCVCVCKIVFLLYCFFLVLSNSMQIWVPTNPRGAERLPPGVIVGESDLYTRRLWGLPGEVCMIHHQTLIQ